LNTFKRLFVLVLAASMALAAFPLAADAAGVALGAVNSQGGRLELTGRPSGTYYGAGEYTFEAVPQAGAGLALLLTFPGGGTQTVASLSGSTSVSWRGLLVKPLLGDWLEGDGVTFTIVPTDGDTTVSGSSNTVLDASSVSGVIRKGRSIKPRFTVVDYNVRDDEVETAPHLTGYQSNDSFPLSAGTAGVVVERVAGGTNGMATFTVTIPVKYTGVGNSLSFTLSYRTKSDVVRTLDCYAALPNVEEYVEQDDDDGEDDDEPEPLTPYIIVESYSYGGTSVTAGEEFSLRLSLRNTSTANTLQNIVMSVSPQGVFSMASSSNTIYIDQLFAGSTMEKTVTIKTGLSKVTDDDDVNSININFSFQYLADKVRKSSSSSESITIPVDFPDRFELGIPEMDGMVFSGQECYISVPMVNKGRSGVYNLTATIRGDMSNPGQSQYIGNLTAGSESSADFLAIFSEPGERSGEVVVTYEDANMNPKELTVPFSISVQSMEDMFGPNPGMEEPFPDPEEPGLPTDAPAESSPAKTAMIAVAIAVCAMSAYVTVQKAKAKRSIYLDEDI
jgi:hypothetical protein